MIATGRPFAGWHGSHTGRTPRSRNARVNDGIRPVEPRAVTSSNNAVAHRCGSSRSRAVQYASVPAERVRHRPVRGPRPAAPVQVGLDRFRSLPTCRAIAEIDQPRFRSAWMSTSSSCVSMKRGPFE